MKKMKKSWVILTSLWVCLFLFNACDNDDKEVHKGEIYGKWTLNNVSTDNQLLNTSLNLLLGNLGINYNDASVTFGEDNFARFHVDRASEPVEEEIEYVYAEGELEILIGSVLPIDKFLVYELTSSRLTLDNTLSPDVLRGLIQLVKNEDSEIGTLLESVLNSNMTNGLTITLQFSK